MTNAAKNVTCDLVSAHAHRSRNALSTLKTVSQLIEDPEIADAISEATTALIRENERVITAARCAATHVERHKLSVAELLRLAQSRAKREGNQVESKLVNSLENDAAIDAPGSILERLFADLIHLNSNQQTETGIFTIEHEQLQCQIKISNKDFARYSNYLKVLIEQCGGELSFTPTESADTESLKQIQITFPVTVV